MTNNQIKRLKAENERLKARSKGFEKAGLHLSKLLDEEKVANHIHIITARAYQKELIKMTSFIEWDNQHENYKSWDKIYWDNGRINYNKKEKK